MSVANTNMPPNDPPRGPFGDGFRVIETLRCDAAHGPIRLGRHLARMSRTCAALNIPFPDDDLDALLARVSGDFRIRLTVDAKGMAALEQWPFVEATQPWRVAIAEQHLSSADPWLRIKTTRREIYDKARAALPEGVDELIFLNERGEICEGTITNIFVRDGETLLTPPLTSGLLPGILREELLETSKAREAVLRPDDLQGAELYIGNSLRGLISAQITPAE